MNNNCLMPGTVLGEKYQIIKLIGQGGMGTVYMAYDIHLDLQVAIKTISPGLIGNDEASDLTAALKRFEAEAKIAAKIDHPNVVRVFGYQTDSVEMHGEVKKTEFLVMELLSGRTLRNTMDISGFEHEAEIADWIIKYLIPILDGLEKVHECGIIHRDIKPENFLMKDNTPKLADFGLSMGFNFPAVTGSIADIFGTAPYVAPEQFYNFSIAREAADVYSIGKILYEVVEGKMTDKVKPFKQMSLSHPDTEFLKQLDRIIRDATAENIHERTSSACELKKHLNGLIFDGKPINPEQDRRAATNLVRNKTLIVAVLLLFLTAGAWAMHFAHNNNVAGMNNMDHNPDHLPGHLMAESTDISQVHIMPYEDSAFEPTIQASDNSVLHFIPPATLTSGEENGSGNAKTSVNPFYVSENPVTNGQYAAFLNEIPDRVTIRDDDVFIDNRLAITLGEKIRGYVPISYDGRHFSVQHPMHSACGVLLVSGFGAETYAEHYGMRLQSEQEWIYISLMNDGADNAIIPLPVPVMDYEKNSSGLRGIGQIAEWSINADGDLVIMDPAISEVVGSDNLQAKDPDSYYTDTGFRVAKDVAD